MIDLKTLEPGMVLEVVGEEGLQTYTMLDVTYSGQIGAGNDAQTRDLFPDAILEEGTAFMFMGLESGDKDAYFKEYFVIFHNEQTMYGLPQDEQQLTRFIGRLTL